MLAIHLFRSFDTPAQTRAQLGMVGFALAQRRWFEDIFISTMEKRLARVDNGYEHLATKADIQTVLTQMAEIRGEFRGIKWTLIASIALAGLAVGILAFSAR